MGLHRAHACIMVDIVEWKKATCDSHALEWRTEMASAGVQAVVKSSNLTSSVRG